MEVKCLYGYDEKRVGKNVIFLEEGEYFDSPDAKVFFINPENEDEVLRKIAWEFLFTPFVYEESREIFSRLERIRSEVNYFASDFADLGFKLFDNFRKNITKETFLAKDLFGRFQNIPAIVCGAGPSLAKNSSLLKDLKDRALIFAGGAATSLPIPFHFAAHVDPDPAHRLKGSDVPLFYQLRTCHEIVSKACGIRLLVEGNGNFPLEDWVHEGTFDGGWTVGTFCIALAHALGCNPIYLVGMDLCATAGHLYAPGIEKTCDKLVSVKNKKGEEVYARPDWLLAAEWIEDFAKKHPKIINATEGGLGFEGVEEVRLADVHLEKRAEIDLQGLQKVNLHHFDIKPSLVMCHELINGILKELEAIHPRRESGTLALLESDLAEQVAAQKILEPAWSIWHHLLVKHGDPILHKLLFYKNLIQQYL